MGKKYKSFADLAASETEAQDYERKLVKQDSDIAVIAPHGGGIEQGTSEIAEAVAGEEFSLYCFNGLKGTGNEDLHVTSTRFDEPQALELMEQSQVVIAVHGLEGEDETVYVGGRHRTLKTRFIEALNEAGFEARKDESYHSGTFSSNICNRGAGGRGVQLEISRGLRCTMFESLKRKGRESKKLPFHRFVEVIRDILLSVQSKPLSR
jgi:phage replication-related protein YjqB (UPF0714/DUF867 family)